MGCGGEEYSEPASGEAGPLRRSIGFWCGRSYFTKTESIWGKRLIQGCGRTARAEGGLEPPASRPFLSGLAAAPGANACGGITTGTKEVACHGAPFTSCRFYRSGHHGPLHVPQHPPGRISGHRVEPDGRPRWKRRRSGERKRRVPPRRWRRKAMW